MPSNAMGRGVAVGRIFKQDAQCQPRAVLFADPGQFQFLSAVGHDFIYDDHAVYDCEFVIIAYTEWKRRILRMQEKIP